MDRLDRLLSASPANSDKQNKLTPCQIVIFYRDFFFPTSLLLLQPLYFFGQPSSWPRLLVRSELAMFLVCFRTQNGQLAILHHGETDSTEHYLTPLHLALRSPAASSLPFKISLQPFPSGTGHMITSLRENEIDIGIGLTEGWVAGLAGKQHAQKDPATDGYKVVGHWVDNPLRWAIVTGRNRDSINGEKDLKDGRVGISRPGR